MMNVLLPLGTILLLFGFFTCNFEEILDEIPIYDDSQGSLSLEPWPPILQDYPSCAPEVQWQADICRGLYSTYVSAARQQIVEPRELEAMYSRYLQEVDAYENLYEEICQP